MKKILLVITGLAISVSSIAQGWSWATSLGGRSSADGVTGIERDGTGNFYVCGDFEGTRNFGGTSITAVGLSDYYLTKFDVSGNHLWTVPINGTGANVMEASGVTSDVAGNVYVAGNFSYNAVFGATVFTNPSGNNDAFIAKYSPSGALLWAKTLTGNGNERISAIEALGTDIFISGSYTQAINFGALSLAAPAGGFEDAFLIKMDSTGTGQLAIKGGGTADDRATSISVSANAVFWAGYFSGTANFGGTSLAAVGSGADMFLVKFNALGVQQWAKRYGGNFGQQIYGVSQDPWGNAICTGNFYGTASFGTGFNITEAYAMFPAGNGDAFVVKINGVDGTCQWVRQIKCINGDNNEVSAGVSTDPGGSTYVTGSFNGTTSFATNASQTGTTLSATNGKDAFVAKYDQYGTLSWVQKIGGSSNDQGKAVIWDANGYCNVAGNFGSTITLGTNLITASPGSASLFLARYSGLSAGIEDFDGGLSFEVFPNPASDNISIRTGKDIAIEKVAIYSVNGVKLIEEILPFRKNETTLDGGPLPAGFYFVHLSTSAGTGIRKIQVM